MFRKIFIQNKSASIYFIFTNGQINWHKYKMNEKLSKKPERTLKLPNKIDFKVSFL